MDYKILNDNIVLRLTDNANIPVDTANIDYQTYLQWLSRGNTPEPAGPIPVPPISVSPRQIRQALTAAGIRAQVEVVVAAGSQDLQDWWEFATSIEENHTEVLAMASALGLTDEQRHALFVAAKAL